MNDSNKAIMMVMGGFQCSQAVFVTLGEQLDIESKQALKLSTGFGGGISGLGDICGAVSGAIMAIGLKHGYDEAPDVDARDKVFRLTKELIYRIKAKHGCYTCKGLIGMDFTSMSIEEARKLYWEQGIAEKICHHVIIDCIEIVEKVW